MRVVCCAVCGVVRARSACVRVPACLLPPARLLPAVCQLTVTSNNCAVVHLVQATKVTAESAARQPVSGGSTWWHIPAAHSPFTTINPRLLSSYNCVARGTCARPVIGRLSAIDNIVCALMMRQLGTMLQWQKAPMLAASLPPFLKRR